MQQPIPNRTDPIGCLYRCPNCVTYEFTRDSFIIYDGGVILRNNYVYDPELRRLTASVILEHRGEFWNYDVYFSVDFSHIECGTLVENDPQGGRRVRTYGSTGTNLHYVRVF
jgi:hypothetical protein